MIEPFARAIREPVHATAMTLSRSARDGHACNSNGEGETTG
jgi:hypothetical protein